jgi:Tyrosine phosphatase family
MAVLIWALVERPLRSVWFAAKDRGVLGLSIAAALLIALRQVACLDVEPIGFWPRWLYVWGLFAWSFVLLRLAPAAPIGWSRNAIVAAMVLISLGLDFAGRGIFWFQRPIHRLREVDPGRIYVSAMPTYRGLKLAQERYHFRTIINLFPESTPEQSPYWPDELRFAREHNLNYVGNPSRDGTGGDAFIAQTLELSRDPQAWPILVHCHASMDRSPAWMAMYRFVVQGWTLADAIKELERHRGLRPRASVTVLYDEVLPRLAPERCAADPTFALLKKYAKGTDEFRAQAADPAGFKNSTVAGRDAAQSVPRR